MSTRIAAILALLLALSGWLLYKQVQASGELKAQIEQRDAQLLESARQVGALSAEIAARDKAITELEAKRDELANRTERVRTVVREVYRQPEVRPWAETPVPPPVADAVTAGIDELYQPAGTTQNAGRGDRATGGDDAGLSPPER